MGALHPAAAEFIGHRALPAESAEVLQPCRVRVSRAATGAHRLLVAAFVLALTACTSMARHPAPAAPDRVVSPGGLPASVRIPALDASLLGADSAEAIARLRGAAEDGTLDILALSGGGAGGAFGAGALVGWSARGDRPQFDVVTGVSAGALIAPFAFLGRSWDARLADALAGAGTSNVLQRRTIDLFFRPSIYRGQPLVDFIDRAASDDLIAAVARESAGGRMLVVATTDLDREATVLWDLGAIARYGTPAARALFRKVLVASSSIPGVFPPVLIDAGEGGSALSEMHVDGGATVSFFVAPEIALIVPGSLSELAGARLYVLMNTQMAGIPATTEGRLGPILARASATALTQMSRSQLQLASAFAQERGIELRVTEIPVDYPYGGSIDFGAHAMRTLFEYGARCAERGLLWTTMEGGLRRTEEAVARVGSAQRPAARRVAGEAPCPAEFSGTDAVPAP